MWLLWMFMVCFDHGHCHCLIICKNKLATHFHTWVSWGVSHDGDFCWLSPICHEQWLSTIVVIHSSSFISTILNSDRCQPLPGSINHEFVHSQTATWFAVDTCSDWEVRPRKSDRALKSCKSAGAGDGCKTPRLMVTTIYGMNAVWLNSHCTTHISLYIHMLIFAINHDQWR